MVSVDGGNKVVEKCVSNKSEEAACHFVLQEKMTEQLAYARHEQALKTSCVLFDKKAQCQDVYEHFFLSESLQS